MSPHFLFFFYQNYLKTRITFKDRNKEKIEKVIK